MKTLSIECRGAARSHQFVVSRPSPNRLIERQSVKHVGLQRCSFSRFWATISSSLDLRKQLWPVQSVFWFVVSKFELHLVLCSIGFSYLFRKLHLQLFNRTSDLVLWSEIQSALFKRLSFLISSLNSATTLLFNQFRGLFSKWTPELQHYYFFDRCSDWFVRATSSFLFSRFSDWFVPQFELLHSCSIGYSDRFVLQIQLHLSCWIGFLIDLFCKLSYIILVPLVFWSICSVSRATSFLFNRLSESFVLQIEIHHSCESGLMIDLLCKWSYIILVQSVLW
jgi:hypothetical protein